MKSLTKTALIIGIVMLVPATLFFAKLTESENLLLPYLGEIVLSIGCTVGIGLAVGELVHRQIKEIGQ